jgi:hypothetical protein
MRYEVSCELGLALVDAIDADDAGDYMEAEYGRASGPYEVEQVDQNKTSCGFDEMKIHRTPAFIREMNKLEA